ncbi:MAG: MFS transporter, partial [Chloroflexi bacterium]|nr:MFS transporter [Chloroflexota bacterium]
PFLIFGAPAVAALTVLLWTPPGGESTWLNAAYFILVTIAFFSAFSLVGIPYDGTLPEMAPEAQPRVVLSYWKNVFGLAGVLVGSIVAAPLFESIGAVAMGAVVGGVALVTIWMSLLGLREAPPVAKEPLGALEGLRVTMRNRQFLYVFVSTLFVHIAYQMLLANLPYFVTLVVGMTESDVAIFQGGIILIMGLTGPLWGLWNKRLSQRKLLNLSMVGLAISLALGYFVGRVPGLPVMAQGLIVIGLAGFTLGGYFIVIYAMMGNVVDYDEMITGRRREAIFYGTFSFALGLGVAVGTLILPQLYNLFGYTRANPQGVLLAYLVMALCMGLGYWIFQGYRLGDTPAETRQNLGLPEAVNNQVKDEPEK